MLLYGFPRPNTMYVSYSCGTHDIACLFWTCR